jgi:hypothetical protein
VNTTVRTCSIRGHGGSSIGWPTGAAGADVPVWGDGVPTAGVDVSASVDDVVVSAGVLKGWDSYGAHRSRTSLTERRGLGRLLADWASEVGLRRRGLPWGVSGSPLAPVLLPVHHRCGPATTPGRGTSRMQRMSPMFGVSGSRTGSVPLIRGPRLRVCTS